MDTSSLGLQSLGGIGAIFLIFWAIASILMPFIVWGIYNQTNKSAKELYRLRKLIEHQIKPEGAEEEKVGMFD